MNSRIKRFHAVSLVLLILLNCLLTAAQNNIPKTGKVYTDYGLESEMRIPSQIMRSTMSDSTRGLPVSKIRRLLLLFREAGGIMFDAAAMPCAALNNAQLSLSYNRTKPNGRRLTLRVGTTAYTVPDVYDRDLRPIAEFAGSSVPVLTNVQYPDDALRQSCPLPGSLRIVTLHPAFLNTSLGRLLTVMDSVPWSFRDGKRWISEAPLPQNTVSLSKLLASVIDEENDLYNEAWPERRVEFINAGKSVLASMNEDQKIHYAGLLKKYPSDYWQEREADILELPGLNKRAWNMLSVNERRILLLFVDSLHYIRVSNINDDEEATPSFCTQASSVSFNGTPRLEFVAPRYARNYVLEDSSALMTKNMPQLRLIEPEAYDALMKIYYLNGLFRYVKRQSPSLWTQFLKSLPPKERVDTYTIVCPDCKKAKVEEWLDCVERNFPSEPIRATRR